LAGVTELFVSPGATLPAIPPEIRRHVKLKRTDSCIALSFVREIRREDPDDPIADKEAKRTPPTMIVGTLTVDRWIISGAHVGFSDRFVRVRSYGAKERITLMDSRAVVLIKNGRADWNFRFCKTCGEVTGVPMKRSPKNKLPRGGDFWFHCYHCGSWWKRRLDYEKQQAEMTR
jgi:hypothetical protein